MAYRCDDTRNDYKEGEHRDCDREPFLNRPPKDLILLEVVFFSEVLFEEFLLGSEVSDGGDALYLLFEGLDDWGGGNRFKTRDLP